MMKYSCHVSEEKSECIREIKRGCSETFEYSEEEHYVGKIHDAPDFLRDNEYIHSGYRINFNSYWKIFKSLFVIHNESVNVWSHILGAIVVVSLIFYTSAYITSHKTEIIEAIDHKWNEDWTYLNNFKNLTNDLKHTFEEGKDFLHNYAEKIKNKTVDYFNTVDEKLNEYKDYLNEKINCIDCIRNLLIKFSEMKSNFQANLNDLKEKMKSAYEDKMSSMNITNFDFDLKALLDELNEKLMHFKDEIVETLDSREMEWIDVYKKQESFEDIARLSRWPLFVFLVSAIACLSFSATFHLCFVHSVQLSAVLARLDYAGISILIAGSCYPPYYYLFYCSSNFMVFYLSFITTFALAVLIFSFRRDFTEPSKRKLRGFLFLTLGISAAIPILHLAFFDWTIAGNINNPTLINWVLGGFCYIGGCLIYINRLPERIWPGKFCIWGSSHQIWHLLVFSGIVFHFFGCLDSYHDRLAQHKTC